MQYLVVRNHVPVVHAFVSPDKRVQWARMAYKHCTRFYWHFMAVASFSNQCKLNYLCKTSLVKFKKGQALWR